ncbi:Cro/CI family transcriptional regulator [Lonsdalea britannica]|uniref:Cro/CI family transcriptional regulator n=1 Tax=Lonsdalea britannica TaxID=1082704 RepID=UPI0026ED0B3A|nr:Cro/CI family transcriptional regulator [Lonsdalea britannica]
MEKIPLADYVRANGQAKAASEIGVHQTAISKAVRVGRKIFITRTPDGKVEAEEHRPFPSNKHLAV